MTNTPPPGPDPAASPAPTAAAPSAPQWRVADRDPSAPDSQGPTGAGAGGPAGSTGRDPAGIIVFCLGVAAVVLHVVVTYIVFGAADVTMVQMGFMSSALRTLVHLISAALMLAGVWLMVRPVVDRAWASAAVVGVLLVRVVVGFGSHIVIGMIASQLSGLTTWTVFSVLQSLLIDFLVTVLTLVAWVLVRGWRGLPVFLAAAGLALVVAVVSAVQLLMGYTMAPMGGYGLGGVLLTAIPPLLLTLMTLGAMGVLTVMGRRAVRR